MVSVGSPPKSQVPGAVGDSKHGVEQFRYRAWPRREGSILSCISEQNTVKCPSSEDECLSSCAEAARTPLLKPIHPRSHRQGRGKSPSSDGSFSVSPFLLDSEQIDGPWAEGLKHPGNSTWRCTVSIESNDQPKTLQVHPSVSSSGSPKPVFPRLYEVEWKTIRWEDCGRRMVHIERHIRTLSGTGFDGSLSYLGETSSFQSPTEVSSPLPGPLAPSNCPSCKSRKVKSDTSGSINWEKSWPKRKPRRVHNVSESSDFGSMLHTHPSIVIENGDIEEERSVDSPTMGEQKDQQYQLPSIQECALKSCPDFHQPPPLEARPVMPGRYSVCFYIF